MGSSKDIIIKNKYIIKHKIGQGNFGKIFLGKNKYTNEEIAIKIDTGPIILKNEAIMYNYLSDINGIPKLRAFGKEGKYNYLILDLLGDTLVKKLERNNYKFTLNNIVVLGIKLIDIISKIHKKNIIHRDIKPENIMYKNRDDATDYDIYIIDFGLSKIYDETKKGCIKNENLIVGTANFASLHTHIGNMPSKRDDLESIGYVLLYAYYGKLPWSSITYTDNNERINFIKKCKQNLLNGETNNIINLFIKKCNRLKYDDNPDYAGLKTLLRSKYNL
jgi:casein kinase I family protein HRR25